VLEVVGKWLDSNGRSIYETERGDLRNDGNTNFTRRGNTLYVHQKSWPGHTPAAEWLSFFKPEVVIAIGGLKPKVTAARLLKSGEKVTFTQDEDSFRLTSLPIAAPDSPTTVIELECDAEPVVDHNLVRLARPRYKADASA
jgi:alpha-L-fucosidase